MARYTGPKMRLSRREGIDLELKSSPNNASGKPKSKKKYPPGQHGQRRTRRQSEYGLQLREKQKVRRYYGVLERQFRGYFARAARTKGNTGSALMSLLERRLDNVVHRLGWGLSRSQARQLVAHGHITVNGHRVDIPSYLVKPGDVVRVKNRAKSLQLVQANLAEYQRDVPEFLSRIDGGIPEGRINRLPATDDISIPVQTQLIIELCSQ